MKPVLIKTTLELFLRKKKQSGQLKGWFDLIIAAGGDGTINEVVNGVAPWKIGPCLAFIPTGTTNDHARALKIPMGKPVEAARIIR